MTASREERKTSREGLSWWIRGLAVSYPTLTLLRVTKSSEITCSYIVVKLWDLRCEIREKLMQFIIETYPQYLSKRRNITSKNDLYEQPSEA